jgi:hypothetical protein
MSFAPLAYTRRCWISQDAIRRYQPHNPFFMSCSMGFDFFIDFRTAAIEYFQT